MDGIISLTERTEARQRRIDYLIEYDHTKREDLIGLARNNITKHLPSDFMEIWTDYITNPRNDQKYKYKIYLPLDIDNSQNKEGGDYPLDSFDLDSLDIVSDNHNSNRCNKCDNRGNTLIYGEHPPTYSELYDNNYDSTINTSDLDMYESLILSDHKSDLITYDLIIQYKQNIKHSLMILMQEIVTDMIDDYDTLWLDVDGYALKYKVKIKYNYTKSSVIGDFTGIVIVLRLCTLEEFNEIRLDSPVPSRCFSCFRDPNN